MKITQIKINPSNPRIIKDENFRKLVKSIKQFPKMMELRPIIVDEEGIIQGGNMRYKALKELRYKEIPDNWVKQGKDLTPEQWKEFVIKDNVSFGEWDYDELEKEWDSENLGEWGVEVESSEKTQKQEVELIPFKTAHILISYELKNHQEVIGYVEKIIEEIGDMVEIETAAN